MSNSKWFRGGLTDEAGVDLLSANDKPIKTVTYLNLTASSAVGYLRFYSKAKASVTIATDAPDYVIPMAGDGADHVPVNIEQGYISVWACTTHTGATGAADAYVGVTGGG